MSRRRKQMTRPAKIATAVLAVLQVAFAGLAFWDLSKRAPEQIRGTKAAWFPALFINWFGPSAYFLFGVRRD